MCSVGTQPHLIEVSGIYCLPKVLLSEKNGRIDVLLGSCDWLVSWRRSLVGQLDQQMSKCVLIASGRVTCSVRCHVLRPIRVCFC